jgi:hypothetical protein
MTNQPGAAAPSAQDPAVQPENQTANQSGDASSSHASPAADPSLQTDSLMTSQAGDALNSLSQPEQDSAVQTENQTILGLHALMEDLGHQTDLVGTTHGLTNDGETVGLGKVGGDNSVTDTAQAPGDILNGTSPVADAANLVTDAGHDVSATGGFVQGIGTDLSNPDVVQDVANGLTDATLGSPAATLGSPNGSPMVSAGVGPSDGSPILDAGVLTSPDGGTPISVAAGNGQNLANVQALDSSGDHLIAGNAGAAGGTPLADTGLLTTPDSQSPLGVDAGNGPNLADASLLGNSPVPQDATGVAQSALGPDSSGEHLITGDAGAAGGSPIADAGVLTTPDSQSPVGVGVANAQNLANADLLGHSDVLSFPSMGGTGTDALTGLTPTGIDLGNITGASTSGSSDASLVDAHTDGGPVAQIHDNPTSVVGVNDHALV